MRRLFASSILAVALLQTSPVTGPRDVMASTEVAWTYGAGGTKGDFFGALQPLEDGSILTIWSEDDGAVTYAKKFDEGGNLQWTELVPSAANSGAFSAAGSVIAANGDVIFYGGVAQDLRVDSYTSDAAIVSLTTSGLIKKNLQFGGPGSESVKSIAVCSDGSFFVGGTVWSASIDPGNTTPLGLVDLFISRFDANFNRLWIKQLGSTNNDALFSMRCDSTNTVSMSAWGAASINGAGDDDYYNFYLIKYDASGAAVSTLMTERDLGFWSPQSGVTAPDGSFYVVGEHNSKDLGSLPCTEKALGGSFVAKYSATGELLWRQIIDCANLNRSADIDAWGNIYVLGSASSRRIAGQQKYGGDDILLHKYTSDGERLWTRQFGSPADEYAMEIALDATGNVLIGGQGKGVIDGYTPQGDWDVFLMKNRVGDPGVAATPPENLLPPVYVPTDPQAMTFMSVTAGGYHSCGILTNQDVWCWGRNAQGQLGDGTTVQSASPIRVLGATAAQAVSAGGEHTCAIVAGGGIKCWGDNIDGQIGDGTTDDKVQPTSTAGIENATRLAAGIAHNCVVDEEAAVWCWGLNDNGQAGDSTTVSPRLIPGRVLGLSGAVDVTAGNAHSCAVFSNGSVKCWGNNEYGQLGDGSNVIRPSPVAVVGISNAVSVSAGGFHTCAGLTTGAVKCWGRNDFKQLGDGTTEDSPLPISVAGISTATSLALGRGSSCARLTSGGVSCWGTNTNHELADGTTVLRPAPVAVLGVGNASFISARYAHTCAVMETGKVSCWGYNSNGQLGGGYYLSLGSPTDVSISQEIVATLPTSLRVDADATDLTRISDKGLPLTYTSNTPLVCIVESYQLIPLAPGNCRLTIRQPGNIVFSEAIAVNKLIVVTELPRTSTETPPTNNQAPSGPTTQPPAESPPTTSAPATGTSAVKVVRLVGGGSLNVANTSTTGKTVTARTLFAPSKGVTVSNVQSRTKYVCTVIGKSVKMLKPGRCRLAVDSKSKSRLTTTNVTVLVTRSMRQ